MKHWKAKRRLPSQGLIINTAHSVRIFKQPQREYSDMLGIMIGNFIIPSSGIKIVSGKLY